jgi:phosphonate transport system substrate-binding protein
MLDSDHSRGGHGCGSARACSGGRSLDDRMPRELARAFARMAAGLLSVLVAMFAVAPAPAQDWKAKYPELVFAVVPAENASGVVERYTPLTEYLGRQLGVPVKLRIVADYAGVIEGQRNGGIQIGYYGPAAYARAYLTGGRTEPFAVEVNADGTKSYHSVFYVRQDSPYQKIEDLRGKVLGLVDPNSTSGNSVPRFAFHKMGIVPETYFDKVIYTGSHENAIIALKDGTVDVCANWWTSDEESNLRRMEKKGMPGIAYADFRIVFISDPIVNAPLAYLSDLPDDLKRAIRDAILNIETNDKATFEKLSGAGYRPWAPVSHADYEPVVELVRFLDALRKKRT